MNNALRASFWSGLATGIRIIGLLFVAKIAAVYCGTVGMGYIGQLSSVMTIFAVVAGGGLTTGLVKVLSQHQGESKELDKIFSTAFSIILLFSSSCFVILTLFYRPLSQFIFGDQHFRVVLIVLAFAQILIGFSNLFLATLSAKVLVKEIFIANLVSVPIGVSLHFMGAYFFGIKGALLGILAYQSSFLIGYSFMSLRRSGFNLKFNSHLISKRYMRELLAFSVMAISTAIIGPTSQILIRNIVNDHFGWQTVGLYQATLRISDVFLLFVTTLIGSYYLPQLSRASSRRHAVDSTIQVAKIVLPLTFIFALSVYLFSDSIIPILFTNDFSTIRNYMPALFIADFVKVFSWLFSFAMIAGAFTKTFIISELLFSSLAVVLSFILVPIYGVKGVFYGNIINALIYLIFSILLYLLFLRRLGENA